MKDHFLDQLLEIAIETSPTESEARDRVSDLAAVIRESMMRLGLRAIKGKGESWELQIRRSDWGWDYPAVLLWDGVDIEGVYSHPVPFCRPATASDLEKFLTKIDDITRALDKARRRNDSRFADILQNAVRRFKGDRPA